MRRLSCLLFVTLLSPLPAAAQTTPNGSIRGTARDEQGSIVPGVTVSATSAAAPGIHQTTTDRQGRYRLGDLPPGDYTVAGEIAGFARFIRSPITMRAGLNVDVDLVLRVGRIDEVVEVQQDTPLIETQHAGQSVNITGELVRALPLLERHEWFGALTLAPGVTSAEWVNNERLFYVHGADSGANIVQIDGADLTPAQGSAIRQVGLSTDAVDDIQIKTSGVDASAPLGIGGIVNIATASGTNALKAAGAISYQPRAWNGSNTPGGTSSTVTQAQTDLSIGAPIVRDRLWAFAAYRYTDATSGVSRTAAQLEPLRGLIPAYQPTENANSGHFWFAKLTAQPSPSHQLTAFYQYDRNRFLNVNPTAQNVTPDLVGGSGASVRLASVWSNRLTTRAGASFNDKRSESYDSGGQNPFQPVYVGTILSGGRLTGNGQIATLGSPVLGFATRPNSKMTISLDATLVVGRAWGSHELQTGVYAQPRLHREQRVNWVNSGFVMEELVLRRAGDVAGGTVPFHRRIMDGTDVLTNDVDGEDYAVYVQDAWRPTSRLTLSAGLRVDRVTWQDRLFDVRAQRSTEVGPRLGVNYAVTADARNVARAHWVLVHDQPAQMASSVGSAALGFRDLYDLNLDGSFETTFVTPSTFALTAGRIRDPDLHQPFVREWGAGYARQLPGRTSVGVDFVHRVYKDRPTLVETNGRYEAGRFMGYRDETFNDTFLVTNNRWNQPVYASVEVSLTKRTARVQGIASYVRQWRHIGGTWQPSDPASFIQPTAFANDRGLGSPTGSLASTVEPNSLSGTHMTQSASASAQWQDHAFRSGLTWTGPWGLLLATSYTFQSGAWGGPIVTRLSAADPAFGPSTVTLSNRRVVSNPLSTVIRFAYPTRGEGQMTTPRLHVWNARLGRRFSMRGVRFDAAIDAFNLTNNGADMSFRSGANQQYNPLFGMLEYRQLPRSAQVSLRSSF